MDEDNIIWTEVLKKTAPLPSTTDDPTATEPCQLESPTSLYEYLKEQCNPKRYMSPYNKVKVAVSNELYNRLLGIDESRKDIVRDIRDEAIRKLGIVVSTKALYEKLLAYCNPEQFLEPYNFDAIKTANYYYPLIKQHRNDILTLENLAVEIYRNEKLKSYNDLLNKGNTDTEKAEIELLLKNAVEEDAEEGVNKVVIILLLIAALFFALLIYLHFYPHSFL